MSEVIVLVGAGSIGKAIARRVSAGKRVVLADLNQGNAGAAVEGLSNAGFEVSTMTVDVSSRQSIHALADAAAAIWHLRRRRPTSCWRFRCWSLTGSPTPSTPTSWPSAAIRFA